MFEIGETKPALHEKNVFDFDFMYANIWCLYLTFITNFCYAQKYPTCFAYINFAMNVNRVSPTKGVFEIVKWLVLFIQNHFYSIWYKVFIMKREQYHSIVLCTMKLWKRYICILYMSSARWTIFTWLKIFRIVWTLWVEKSEHLLFVRSIFSQPLNYKFMQ